MSSNLRQRRPRAQDGVSPNMEECEPEIKKSKGCPVKVKSELHRLLSYLRNYWPCAGGFSVVNAIFNAIASSLAHDSSYGNRSGKEEVESRLYYWTRKAVVILFPAYILCCMFGVLDPPKPLMQNAWNDVMMALGKGPRIFSAAELKAEGRGRRPMLSILGEVFDVSKGDKHYGKKGSYRGFTGRDATRAFVSGDFTEAGLTDDLSGLKPSECLGIKDWHAFYKKDNKYKQLGILAGRFYDAKGKPTKALEDFEKCAQEGREEKEREAAEKLLYPNCNSRWSAAEGGRVWCQDPKKVPRKFREKAVHGSGIRSAGSSGDGVGGDSEADLDAAKVKGRCCCFDVDYAEANRDTLLSFAGCAPDSNSCVTKPPEPMKTK